MRELNHTELDMVSGGGAVLDFAGAIINNNLLGAVALPAVSGSVTAVGVVQAVRQDAAVVQSGGDLTIGGGNGGTGFGG